MRALPSGGLPSASGTGIFRCKSLATAANSMKLPAAAMCAFCFITGAENGKPAPISWRCRLPGMVTLATTPSAALQARIGTAPVWRILSAGKNGSAQSSSASAKRNENTPSAGSLTGLSFYILRVLSRLHRLKGTVSCLASPPSSMLEISISTLRWAICCTGCTMVVS